MRTGDAELTYGLLVLNLRMFMRDKFIRAANNLKTTFVHN